MKKNYTLGRTVSKITSKFSTSSLKKVRLMLDNTYKLVLYEPKKQSENTQQYVSELQKFDTEFYAKLDDNDIIHIMIKNKNGQVISKNFTTHYSEFIQNFRLCIHLDEPIGE